ncbi:MAG: carboxypeptidase-like regulatory domain-containing protein, partial [Terriglobia bacterium]
MQRLTCCFFISAAIACGAVQSGVVRSGGQTIPGAAVTAECGSDKISTVTDSTGRFEMGGLPSTPCKFAVAMFGFEASQREIAASDSALNFDLQLQKRASLPAAASTVAKSTTPDAVPAPAAAKPAPTAAAAAPAPGTAARPQGPNRGGRGAQGPAVVAGGGRGAQGAGRGGFQNLNLVQNGAAAPDSDLLAPNAPGGGVDIATGGGANEAFLVNGSISQAVEAQAGDGIGMGGPGGFGGGGFGGPGGFGGQGGLPGQGFNDGAPGGLPGGDGAGAPGG